MQVSGGLLLGETRELQSCSVYRLVYEAVRMFSTQVLHMRNKHIHVIGTYMYM